MRIMQLFGSGGPLFRRTFSCSVHRAVGQDDQNIVKKRDKKKQHDDALQADLVDMRPEYIDHRMRIWDRCKAQYDSWLSAQPKTPIRVRVLLGEKDLKNTAKEVQIDAHAWQSTPLSIAAQLSKSLAERVLVAKVDNELWDLQRPLERDGVTLRFLRFDDDEGKHVFWHSSAHILGQAMERTFGGLLCCGPPTDDGFYYDIYLKDNRQVTPADYANLERLAKKIVGEKQPFERLEVRKAELLELFAYNQFKCRIIREKIPEEKATVYRCGSLIDLCRGPHVRSTGEVRAFKVTKHGGSHWQGDVHAESLQRVHGIAFPQSALLNDWCALQHEAAKRDHRKIGREQDLFFFHELSPGSCFFLPRGAFIYNSLVELIREEYQKRDYQEVISPNLYNSKLWERSGHWAHYAEHMFKIEVENETFALKPMNCPGHCLMFSQRPRSWRELPIRMADFGVLHRNELSGTLTGLTRVRRFQQDDAHIFCRPDQIKSEIRAVLDFLQYVYNVFGFKLQLTLSTRPEKFLGDAEQWNEAEQQLEQCLNELGQPWKLNAGDGAFYGPKIDILVLDALKRKHQCATVQLDFQLPVRLDLWYITGDEQQSSSTTRTSECAETEQQKKTNAESFGNKKRPVMIHRAILGSVERMIAILTEHYGGKWPFWLSPRQAVVVPIANTHDRYALTVLDRLKKAGFQAEVELDPSLTLNRKVRNAQLAQFNFILVVGDKEAANETVNVRTRDNKVHGEMKLDALIDKFTSFKASRIANAEEAF